MNTTPFFENINPRHLTLASRSNLSFSSIRVFTNGFYETRNFDYQLGVEQLGLLSFYLDD